MVTKAGHKTEGQRHVLTNLTKNNFIGGARKNNLLCLSFVALIGLGVISPAFAQNSPIYASPSRIESAAQTEIRLQEMENQMRQLTGKVENQIYEINSLKNKVRRLEGDVLALGGDPTEVEQPKARIVQAPSQASGLNTSIVAQQNPLGIDLQATDPKPMKKVTVIGGNNNDPTAKYESAYASLKNQNYEAAESGFRDFLAQHNDNVLAANAQYWLGETHYVRGNFKTAAREFAEGFQKFPESAKAPDILLKLGMSLGGMGKNDQACVALAQVPVKFPVGHSDVLEKAQNQRDKFSCDS